MDEDKKKYTIVDLQMAISELRRQVSCGCQGHLFSLCDIMTPTGTRGDKIDRYRFKCIDCNITYWRNKENLTDSEKKQIKAIFGEE